MQAHNAELKIIAKAVEHGSVPALAWKVYIGGKGMVFSGDTNGNNGVLHYLAKKCRYVDST